MPPPCLRDSLKSLICFSSCSISFCLRLCSWSTSDFWLAWIGMANLPALQIVLKTQIYTSFQGILGNLGLKPRLREAVLVCLRVGCYMLYRFRIVRFLFPSHVRTHMLCAMPVQLGLLSFTHIYFEEIKSYFCLLVVYISYM